MCFSAPRKLLFWRVYLRTFEFSSKMQIFCINFECLHVRRMELKLQSHRETAIRDVRILFILKKTGFLQFLQRI